MFFSNAFFSFTENKYISSTTLDFPVIDFLPIEIDIEKNNLFLNTTKKEKNLIDNFKINCPKTYNFIFTKFSNFGKKTQLEFTELIINFAFVLFLKNNQNLTRRPEKLLWFSGGGGTGKSTLTVFLSDMVYTNLKAAGEFSQASGRFESSAFLDKNLIIYADEFLAQKQRELSPQITSVIKKSTSKELKRVEKKYEAISSGCGQAMVLISMNHKLEVYSIDE